MEEGGWQHHFTLVIITKQGKKEDNMSKGRFGMHGGQYIPEILMEAVHEPEDAYFTLKDEPEFQAELQQLLNEYAGRPSRLYYAEKMTRDLGGAKIYLKREDLNHTGSHKINNVLGQALLAKKMGKTKLIAETGAGQHGVATATAAALLDMACEIHMGAVDIEKQALNVYKMELLGAKVVAVTDGLMTLKEAVDSALMKWSNEHETTFYLIGSAVGPHPYPVMVRDFQKVIGIEIKAQIKALENKLPDYVLACVGGGSNAIGAFYDFISDRAVKLIGVEALGKGIETKLHAATMSLGQTGVIHGMQTKVLLEPNGDISPVYSISAGLDYPGLGPEHAYLEAIGRVQYVGATDNEAVEAFEFLTQTEGIIPAIESSHAIAYAMKLARKLDSEQIIVVNLSGRGDKDVKHIARFKGLDIVD